MTKKYSPVTNEQRRLLVKLIYEDGLSIRQAAIGSSIYYPTAKAINKIYIAEKRIDKRQHRFRKIAPRGPTKGLSAQGENSNTELAGVAPEKVTMLIPVREELGFSIDIYDSLDDEMIDVTVERVEEARRQTLPFDHYQITSNVTKQQPHETTSTCGQIQKSSHVPSIKEATRKSSDRLLPCMTTTDECMTIEGISHTHQNGP